MEKELPILIHQLIGHIVAQCGCKAHTVMVVNVSGVTECPACSQGWRVSKLHYDFVPAANGNPDTVSLNIQIEPTKKVTAASILEMPSSGSRL